MTEQEIKQKINDCDRQIVSAYNNLRMAAHEVGSRGYQAAQSVRQSAISSASGSKTAKTLLPLIISVLGLIIMGDSGLLGIGLIVGGIALSYNLNQKANDDQRKTEQQYNSMLSTTEYQLRTLSDVIDNNSKI